MYMENSALAGGFSFRLPARQIVYDAPKDTAPQISLGTEAIKRLENLERMAVTQPMLPQPKPAYIPPPPPIVAPMPPVPVVNIQQPAPVAQAAMPKWAIPAMIGGGGLILILALAGKK